MLLRPPRCAAVVVCREPSHHVPVLASRGGDTAAVGELPEDEGVREAVALELEQLVTKAPVDGSVERVQVGGMLSEDVLTQGGRARGAGRPD